MAQPKIIFIIAVTLCSIGIFAHVFVRALASAPVSEAEAEKEPPVSFVSQKEVPKQEQKKSDVSKSDASPTDPARLVIPSIGVNARVQKVGITKKGVMAVPKNFTDVGWYKYGTIPGESGSAVLAGHVDNGLALPAVFKRLHKLHPGDELYVVSGDGTQKRFVVTDSKVYEKDAETTEIFTTDGPSQLRLITCTGTWIPTERTHDKRLVVTARLDS